MDTHKRAILYVLCGLILGICGLQNSVFGKIFWFLSFSLQILGKTGVVLGQNSKGDIAIRFEGRETDLLLNPRCIEPVTDEPVALKPGEQRYELACTLSGQLYIESSPRPLFPTSEEGGR